METLVISGIVLYVFYVYIKADKLLDHKMRKIKGDSGENIVNIELSKLGEEYKTIYDVKIGIYQIDHIVIHDNSKTIFVIETKRWNGKIRGRKADNKWEQVLGGNSYWMNNPILQNEKHIKALNESNKYLGYKFVNVVVFVRSESIPKLKNVVIDENLYKLITEY